MKKQARRLLFFDSPFIHLFHRFCTLKAKSLPAYTVWQQGTKSVIVLDVFDDVADAAIEDKAEVVDRFRRDGHTALHPIDRVRRHALPIDQLICGNVALVQRFPKGTVGDHADNLSAFFLPYHA